MPHNFLSKDQLVLVSASDPFLPLAARLPSTHCGHLACGASVSVEVGMSPKRFAGSRRQFLLGAAIASASSTATPMRSPDVDNPAAALHAFLIAFENCNLPLMESFFAPDATYFDRFPPGAQKSADYRRGQGMPPGMRELATRLPKAGGHPPYHSVEPRDLLVQSYGSVAVCSFHLTGGETFGRRTVVMSTSGNLGWKIVHIHASNVPLE